MSSEREGGMEAGGRTSMAAVPPVYEPPWMNSITGRLPTDALAGANTFRNRQSSLMPDCAE